MATRVFNSDLILATVSRARLAVENEPKRQLGTKAGQCAPLKCRIVQRHEGNVSARGFHITGWEKKNNMMHFFECVTTWVTKKQRCLMENKGRGGGSVN